MKHSEPNRAFRETWQYNNLMCATAGYLVAETSGMSWEDFTRRRVIEPLGMTSTNFSVDESQSSPNHALPYGEEEKKLKRLAFRKIDNIGRTSGWSLAAASHVPRVRLVEIGEGVRRTDRPVFSSTTSAMETVWASRGARMRVDAPPPGVGGTRPRARARIPHA